MYSVKEKKEIIEVLGPLNLAEEEMTRLIVYLNYTKASAEEIVKNSEALYRINKYLCENGYCRNSINTLLARVVLRDVNENKIIEMDKILQEYGYSSEERENIETAFYRIFRRNPEMFKNNLRFYSDFSLKDLIANKPNRIRYSIASLYAKYRYLAERNVGRKVIIDNIFSDDEKFSYDYNVSVEKLFEEYPLPSRYKISEEVNKTYTDKERNLLKLYFFKMGLSSKNIIDLINKLGIQGIQYEQIKQHLNDIKEIIAHFKPQGYEQFDINTIISQATFSTTAENIIEIDKLFDENNYDFDEKRTVEVSQPVVLTEQKEDINDKLVVYNLENVKNIVVDNPMILLHPLDLSYARIRFIKSRRLSLPKYSDFIVSDEKKFKEKFGISNYYVKRCYPLKK